MKTLTLKVPERLNAELEESARAEGLSKSEFIRDAIEEQVKRKKRGNKAPRVYDLISDLVGSLKGPGDLSTNPKHMEGFGE